MIQANLPELLKVGLRKVFETEFDKPGKLVYEKIFNKEISKQVRETVSGVSGFTNLSPKLERGSYAIDRLYPDPNVVFTHQLLGTEAPISFELTLNDLYGVVKGLPGKLLTAAKRTLDTCGADVFNTIFQVGGAGFTTGGDGKAICATDHPLLGSTGVASNRLSSPAALSITTFAEALFMLKTTKNYRGEPMDLNPKYLLYPAVPSVVVTAFEILKSSGRPDTSDRADNWASQQGIVAVDPYGWTRLNASYGGDDDAWFLLADKSEHSLTLFMRREPVTDVGEDIHTKDIIYTVILYFSIGAENWRGLVGSSGAQ